MWFTTTKSGEVIWDSCQTILFNSTRFSVFFHQYITFFPQNSYVQLFLDFLLLIHLQMHHCPFTYNSYFICSDRECHSKSSFCFCFFATDVDSCLCSSQTKWVKITFRTWKNIYYLHLSLISHIQRFMTNNTN